jgi:uncharacterized protein YyaL (SSP411 family)
MAHDTDRPANRLAGEKSPYLQQHAHNPVDWYPWGEEAFERARREEKPIFLSIGYSTCHWCHVMERESFEDEETARMMNELFVNIKVDREERPDVDNVYMTAAQALTGQGGWPLSAWLTPELRPFYVGTYFPPRSAYGRPGFRDALRSLHEAWVNEREKVNSSARAIAEAIEQHSVIAGGGEGEVDFGIIDECYRQLERSYDPRHGGFGGAPKFPRPVIFEFLLRYAFSPESPRGTVSEEEREKKKALEMTLHTLRKMASGGMYDQLGGGFARYSVDAEWRVPHFEKMLYDQGQLLAVCADACRITKDPELARVIRHTVEYLERDLMHESGAFYSAEDADSEGEEGTFYVWTQAQLRQALSQQEYRAAETYYGITPDGNFEHGKNVLHTSATHRETAEKMGMAEEEIRALLASAREKLFAIRSERIRPHRDEKILTSWNGLMISGLARASAALDEPHYAALARRAADHLIATMNVDGRLMHRLKDGEIRFDGYLEDYAFFAQGLIDLYEATFEIGYLKEAERLVREAERLFRDDEGGGYFMTSGDDTSVLVRSKNDHDGAEPSGNSVMAMNLLRLGRLFYDQEMLDHAERTIRLFTSRIAQYPLMMPLMVAAELALRHAPRQIIIAESPDPDDTKRLGRQIHSRYLPDTALLLVDPAAPDPWLLEKVPTAEGMAPVDGKAAAYICENFLCQRPVTELED